MTFRRSHPLLYLREIHLNLFVQLQNLECIASNESHAFLELFENVLVLDPIEVV